MSNLIQRGKGAIKRIVREDTFEGYMGRPDGAGDWIYPVAHHPGYEYVRIINGTQISIAEAINQGAARRPDILVEIVRKNGVLVVTGPVAVSAAHVLGTDVNDALLGGGGGAPITGAFSYVGYNTVGGSQETISSTSPKTIYKPFTITETALLVSIGAYVVGSNAAATSATVTLSAWLTADISGDPGHMIAISTGRNFSFMVMNTVPRWVDMSVTSLLTPGDYWLACHLASTAGNTLEIYYDTSGADWTISVSGGTYQFDLPEWTATAGTDEYSIRGGILT